MEAELKCRNTASSASGLSFARCWLRAEAVGMEEFSPQKSSISTLVEDEPCETRKEISFWAGLFCFSWNRNRDGQHTVKYQKQCVPQKKKTVLWFVDGSWSCASLRKWYTTNSRAALATSTNLSVARAAAHFAPYVNPLGSFFEKIWVRPTIRG